MIADYATLQAAVATWLARADLTANVSDFIQLAEAGFNRDLRVRQMQTSTSGTITGGSLTLPTDCREVQSLRVSRGGVYRELPVLSPQELQHSLPTGAPLGYVVVNGAAVVVGYTADLPYQLTYWQAIPNLATAPGNTNWLVQKHPDLYLYAALGHSAPFLKDDDRLVTWGTLYRTIRDSIDAEDAGARYGNAPAIRGERGMP